MQHCAEERAQAVYAKIQEAMQILHGLEHTSAQAAQVAAHRAEHAALRAEHRYSKTAHHSHGSAVHGMQHASNAGIIQRDNSAAHGGDPMSGTHPPSGQCVVEASLLATDVSTITPESAFQGQSQSAILSMGTGSDPAHNTTIERTGYEGVSSPTAGGAQMPGPFVELQQAAYAAGPAPLPPDAQGVYVPQMPISYRLQVELDDCYAATEAVVANANVWPLPTTPGGSPLRAHTVGAKSQQERITTIEKFMCRTHGT